MAGCRNEGGLVRYFVKRPEAPAPPQGSPSNSSGLLGRMRGLEIDHTPEGWPSVQMKDISALCQMVEGAKLLRGNPDRLKWNPDGYWLDGVPVGPLLEKAFYLAGEVGTTPIISGAAGNDPRRTALQPGRLG